MATPPSQEAGPPPPFRPKHLGRSEKARVARRETLAMVADLEQFIRTKTARAAKLAGDLNDTLADIFNATSGPGPSGSGGARWRAHAEDATVTNSSSAFTSATSTVATPGMESELKAFEGSSSTSEQMYQYQMARSSLWKIESRFQNVSDDAVAQPSSARSRSRPLIWCASFPHKRRRRR